MNSLFHGLLQTDIRIAGAFCAQIANGGEPGEQRVAQMISRSRNAQAESLSSHLIVPNGFTIRMKHDVRVRVDQTRH